MAEKTYRQAINDWRGERDANIRKDNNWLSLAGLFWLKLGRNQFGSDPASEVQLPARVPPVVGQFEFNGRSVTLRTNPGQKVMVGDAPVEFSILEPDVAENPSFVKLEGLQLVVIQRGNRMGVRLWDNQDERRVTFPARTWFDIDEAYRVPAVFTAYDRPKMAYFPDLTGERAEFPVEGYVTFVLGGATHQLDINKEDDGTLFLRF
ncbi:MAG: DUF1684 domain-containing protein [Chloroflexi bacterium]|nr:DUF1684 domain-containing protein [Chloroflexota bacterium]